MKSLLDIKGSTIFYQYTYSNWQNNKFKYNFFEQQSKRLADITNIKFCKHSVQHTLW